MSPRSLFVDEGIYRENNCEEYPEAENGENERRLRIEGEKIMNGLLCLLPVNHAVRGTSVYPIG